MKIKLMALILVCLIGGAVAAYAEVPQLINYQGRVTATDGTPLNEAAEIEFRIFDVETDGVLLWSETHLSVQVANGVFSVLLGSVDETNNPLDLAFDVPYFLEIVVNSEVMDPRQKITSVAYSMRSKETDALPSGIIIMCRNACPPGYSRVTEFDGKALVGGASYDPNAGSSSSVAGIDTWGTESYAGGTNDSDDWLLAPIVSHENKLYASVGKKGWHSVAKSSPNMEVLPHSASAQLELKKDDVVGGAAMDYGTIYLCEKD